MRSDRKPPRPPRPDHRPRRDDSRRPQRREPRLAEAPVDERVRIFGFHAAEAALTNPARKILRVAVTENAGHRLGETIAARGLVPDLVEPRDLDRWLGADTVHQGVMIEAEPLPEPTLEDLADRAVDGGPLIALDQVTDPHNVGAVLRSAAVFAASGLILPRRHSPPPNGTLAKSASGALELVPLHYAPNLARALDALKDEGFTLLGLDGEATTALEDEPLTGPIVLVLGAEGNGLRQLTRNTCHRLVRIEAAGSLASLNVSNAAAVALHLAAMRRKAHTN